MSAMFLLQSHPSTGVALEENFSQVVVTADLLIAGKHTSLVIGSPHTDVWSLDLGHGSRALSSPLSLMALTSRLEG